MTPSKMLILDNLCLHATRYAEFAREFKASPKSPMYKKYNLLANVYCLYIVAVH